MRCQSATALLRQGEIETLSVLQQTIEDFSSCVDRVVESSGDSERVAGTA